VSVKTDWATAIRRARADDAPALAAFGRQAFTDTFGTLYPAKHLADYLDGAYQPEIQAQEIADSEQAIFVATENAAIAGYLWVGPLTLPIEAETCAVELKRLYLGKAWQGRGLGDALMLAAFDEAKRRGATEMFLSVWVDNHRARRFYARYGFEEVGRQIFWVGATPDDDRIWRLKL
jgi:ribosomal protein S18 acetylase RimI-like enzyme